MADVSFDPNGYRTAGADWASRLNSSFANSRAGGQLATGDFNAGANTLLRSGDLQGGLAVRQRGQAEQQARQTQVTADQARLAAFTLQAAKTLKSVAPEQRGQAYSQLAPTLQMLGQSPQDIEAFGQAMQSNPAIIDQAEQWAGQTVAEWEFRDGGAGDVVAVRQGAEGPESRLVYDAPDRPISTPYGIILPPQPGAREGQGTAQPQATGAAISSDPLWSRQVQQESGGQQFGANGQVLTSPKGAFGVAQLMPGTARDMAREMGVTEEQLRSDPALNEAAGQRYQQQQLQKYGGNQALALAAYNAGPGKVDEWIQRFGDPRTGEITTEEFVSRIPYAETKNYVQNITQGQYGQGDNEGSAGQTSSGLQQLGGGYTLQQMQTPADARADRTEARMDRNEQRSIALENRRARTLTPQEIAAQGFPEGSVVQERPDGSLNVVSGAKSEKFTQDQRTTAGFAYRLENATRTLDRLGQQGVERPSPAILAFGEGRIRENALSQNDRRWLQAAREWLAPVLRRDTGAAVSPGELVTYMNTYLASPTDDPGTLAQKAQARLTAEQAMRGMAGGAYSELVTNIQGQARPNQRPRPQTNTGVVPFDLAPAQLETWRNLGRSGGDASRPRGDRLNPIPLNPAPNASARSWQNIPSGAYFIHPDGTTRRKP